MTRFDELLLAAGSGGEATQRWRDALALVADTAFLCRAWLDEHAPGWTPADLLVMTRMVIDCTPGDSDG
jgi:hypothetical protein